MFVIILTYTKPFPEVEKHLAAHRAFLDRYYDQGVFVCSGPQSPRTGGVILCRAVGRDFLERVILEDPFHIEGVADYRIVEFEATHHAPGFETYLK